MSQLHFWLCRTRGGKLKTFSIRMPPSTACLEGGYVLLEKRMMKEKLERLKETSYSDDVISPPSPPSRHEKWKLARTKPGGEMTSVQAQKIVS